MVDMRILTKENFIIAISVTLMLFFSVFLWTSIGKEGLLPVDAATTIFSMLIQVNATIIGFWGIVFVYYLNSFFERRNNYADQHLKLIDKVEEIESILETGDEKQNKLAKKKLNRWVMRSKDITTLINMVDSNWNDFTQGSIIVLASFLTSIFFSIMAIGKITNSGLDSYWIIFSIVPLFYGIIMIFAGLLIYSPKITKSETK